MKVPLIYIIKTTHDIGFARQNKKEGVVGVESLPYVSLDKEGVVGETLVSLQGFPTLMN